MSDSGNEDQEGAMAQLRKSRTGFLPWSFGTSSGGKKSGSSETEQTEIQKMSGCGDEEKKEQTTSAVSPLSVKIFCSKGKGSGYLEIRSCGELLEADFKHLVSLLTSKPSTLKKLDLTRNSLKEQEVEQLCDGLESPHCRLDTLRLSNCILSERFYAALVSALQLNPSYLRELDLSGNKSLMDSGVKLLSAGLGSPHCRLRTLGLVCCELTESSCASLASALESNPNYLELLDLSGNCLQDAGVRLLCAGLKNPMCKLEILGLAHCLFSDEGCAALVSALTSSFSNLTELDISGNELQHKGMHLLNEFVKSSHCKLKILRVDYGRNLISSGIVEAGKPKREVPEDRPKSVKLRSRLDVLYRRRKLSLRPFQSFLGTPSFDSDLTRDPKEVKTKLDADMLKDNLPFTREKYSAARALPSPPELEVELNPKLSASQDASDAILSAVSGLTLESNKTKMQLDWLKHKAKETKTPSRFTPDLVNVHGVRSYRFKGLCPGVFQCNLTGLVFTMTCEGELLYRTIQWDEGLLHSGGKIPAGPLFNIQGSEDAVSQLHLPHCEQQPSSLPKYLSVAHISDEGMSMLEPVEITDTHVVVDVPHFSAFGLVWDMVIRFLNIQIPVSGQVLLFHRPYANRKLNVFLLAENVPLQEVKDQQENAEYIEAPSSCHLIQGQTYSLQCPEAYRIQPQHVSFDVKYGPNYHPTFEIRLTSRTEEATVTVQDQKGRQAWKYHVELTGLTPASISPALSTPLPVGDPAWLPFPTEKSGSTSYLTSDSTQPPASGAASLSVPAGDEGPDSSRQNPQRTQSFSGEEEKKLFSVRTEFINRVSTSVLKDLLDVLLQERVVNSGEMEHVQAMHRTEKARELIDMVRKKGQMACKILIDNFCELDPFLSEFLQLK